MENVEQEIKQFALIDENNVVVQVNSAARVEDCINTVGFSESDWIEVNSDPIVSEDEDGWIVVDERPNPAGIGYIWNEELQNFIPPKPEEYPSWIFSEETHNWIPPIPAPINIISPRKDGHVRLFHEWDEQNQSWKQIYQKLSKEYGIYYTWNKETSSWTCTEDDIDKYGINTHGPEYITNLDIPRVEVLNPNFVGIGTESDYYMFN